MTTAPITTSDLTKHVQDAKLSLREKIGYGLGDAGGTVITCLIMNFLTFSILTSLGSPRRWSVLCSLRCACLMLFPIRSWASSPIGPKADGDVFALAAMDCGSYCSDRGADLYRAGCRHGGKIAWPSALTCCFQSAIPRLTSPTARSLIR